MTDSPLSDELIEQLLSEDEGAALDLKRDAYPFEGAEPHQKAELLKDILAFANAFRRATAYILVGVEDVAGGRGIIHGINHHPDDASLQQFVNGKTNRPVEFRYRARTVDGKQIGIIEIPVQPRPLYLNKDYGKLKAHAVYVRRSSSTDVALPDEVARMGTAAAPAPVPEVAVSFGHAESDQRLGDAIGTSCTAFQIPTRLPDYRSAVTMPGGYRFDLGISNSNFYREFADYCRDAHRLNGVSVVVDNTGAEPLVGARVQVRAPRGTGFMLAEDISPEPDPSMPSMVFRNTALSAEWSVVERGCVLGSQLRRRDGPSRWIRLDRDALHRRHGVRRVRCRALGSGAEPRHASSPRRDHHPRGPEREPLLGATSGLGRRIAAARPADLTMRSTPEDPLAGMDEAAFRAGVLLPLLRAMGYLDVEHYHGRDEQGKDIVAWKQDLDGSRKNVAVVAKVGNLNASATGDAATVAIQIRQALGSTYTDPTTGERCMAHEVIVATTGSIRDAAREALLTQFDAATRRALSFWNGDKIRTLVDKHLPQRGVPDYLAAVHRQTSGLQHFDVSAVVDAQGVRYAVAARQDGTPFATGVLSFPETPDGDAVLAAVDRHIEAGDPVTVPAEFIESFTLHEELQALFGQPPAPSGLVFGGGTPDPSATMTVEVDGPLGPLQIRGLSVASAQMGARFGKLQTDPDAHPFALSLHMERVDGGVEISTGIQIDPAGHSVHRALQALRVWDAIGAGSNIRLILDSSGETAAELNASSHTHTPHTLAAYLEDLGALEPFLGEIDVPETLTETDIRNAALLRSILTTGVGTRPFDGLTLTYAPGIENVDALLTILSSGEPIWMRELRPAPRFKLLGRDIALGPAHALFQITLDLTEADRVRARLKAGDAQVAIRFNAAGSRERTTVYRDHLPADLRDHYDELRDRMPPMLDWTDSSGAFS